MSHTRTAAAAVVAALALPASASAHVTLQPNTAPAGGFTRLDVRVPNEREDAGTVKVDLQTPPGFEFVSYEPRPGWQVNVAREGDAVSRVTWSGGVVAPGQFVDFGLSLRMPEGEAGEKLTFKALQTYDDGEVVRWIGPEDADEPAPIVTLTAAGGGAHGAPGTGGDTPVSSSAAESTAATVAGDGGSDGVAIAALAIAALALIAGLASLATARRRPVTLRASRQE